MTLAYIIIFTIKRYLAHIIINYYFLFFLSLSLYMYILVVENKIYTNKDSISMAI